MVLVSGKLHVYKGGKQQMYGQRTGGRTKSMQKNEVQKGTQAASESAPAILSEPDLSLLGPATGNHFPTCIYVRICPANVTHF